MKENQSSTVKEMIAQKAKADSACSSTLDAEATVSWKTALDTKSFSGYLQLKLPSFIKFVTTNPFGQTIFALVSDGESYRSVNTLETKFVSGSLATLAYRNDIPPRLLTGNWGTWLSDRIIVSPTSEIADIRLDETGRGVWLVLINPKNIKEGKEFVLYNTASGQVVARILTDESEKPIAKIEYHDWQKESGACLQPTTYQISGLAMGTEITLHLSDIITTKTFTQKDFTIRPPAGYFIELTP